MLHYLNRIDPEKKLGEWAAAAATYGIEETERFAQGVLDGLHFVCLMGFAGAAVWHQLLRKNADLYAAFPVLFLSLTMVLFQNVNALYFWYPSRENHVNMHFVFWVMLFFMALYALFASRPPLTEPDEATVKVDVRNALSWTLVVYLVVLIVAGFANGELTMTSANTRFPVWAWTEGPFPRGD